MPAGRIVVALGVVAAAAALAAVLLQARPERSSAAGNSIASPDTLDGEGTHLSLVLDAEGHPVVSYWDPASGDLKLLHCGSPDCTAGNRISSPDSDAGTANALALDADGHPVVSYKETATDLLTVLHCGNPDCSSGNRIALPDPDSAVGNFSSLALDEDGYPVVSYKDTINGDLKVLHCGNADCSSGNTVAAPDTLFNVGNESSLALDAAGHPVVSYKDINLDDLKVLHCGDADCTSGNVLASPDPDANTGGHTSLELDAGGNPVVSYLEGTRADLRILHCGNANCTAGNSITSPDMGGSVGWYSSLELDASGRPVVSYYDYNRGVLKILHCGNADCTSGNHIALPDTMGHFSFEGRLTSLALSPMERAVVSYFDSVSGELRVLRCADLDCAAKAGTPTATPAATPVPPQGDADCSGRTDARDAALMLQLEAELIDALPCQSAADVNGDGAIDVRDALLVLQHAAGLLPGL